LEKPQAPGVCGGNESGQIAHHAAADGHYYALAVCAQFQKTLPQTRGQIDRLARLAGLDGYQISIDSRVNQAFGHLNSVQFLHVIIGDHYGMGRPAALDYKLAQLGKILGADEDVITPLGKVHTHGLDFRRHETSFSLGHYVDGAVLLPPQHRKPRGLRREVLLQTLQILGSNRDLTAEACVEPNIRQFYGLGGIGMQKRFDPLPLGLIDQRIFQRVGPDRGVFDYQGFSIRIEGVGHGIGFRVQGSGSGH